MKKLISMILVSCMLAWLLPVSSVKTSAAVPSVEEILNDYHSKAFAAEMAARTDGIAAYARSTGGSETSLGKETVDTLNAAGYEAYNVTPDNYDALETSLQTDFADMGLDPKRSDIVVISGEEPSNTSSTYAYGDNLITPTPGTGEGASFFEYTYEGHVLKMRYLTVTTAPSGDMTTYGNYPLSDSSLLETIGKDILNTFLIAKIDDITKPVMLGTVSSLIASWISDDNYEEVKNGELTVHSCTTWISHLIQVWYEPTESWDTAQCSEYTYSQAWCAGFLAVDGGIPEKFDGEVYTQTIYSPKHHYISQRLEEAAEAFDNYSIAQDYIYKVDFYLGNSQGEILYDMEGEPLFSNERNFSIPIHSFD